MAKRTIFINYRRADTRAEAHALHEFLSKEFGKSRVFLDVHDLEAGSHWADELKSNGESASVVLVLIGDTWLQKDEQGNSRIENPNDWVRQEIETALAYKSVIVPVVFDGADMPDKSDLPQSLHALTERQAVRIYHESRKDGHIRLAREINPYIRSGFQRFIRTNRRIIFTAFSVLLLSAAYIFFKYDMAECPNFDDENDINTLLLPSEFKSKRVISYVDSLFDEKCVGRIINQTMLYKGRMGSAISGDQMTIATNCDADVYLKPTSKSLRPLTVKIGFANPTLRQFQIDANMELKDEVVPIAYGRNRQGFDAQLDQAVCILAAYVQKKKGKSKEVIEQLKSCAIDNSIPFQTRVFAFDLMADAYIENEQYDKAIGCLNYSDTVNWNRTGRLEKIAVLLEKENKHEKAIDTWSDLIKSTNNRKPIYLLKRAEQYEQIGNNQEAIQDYKQYEIENRAGEKSLLQDIERLENLMIQAEAESPQPGGNVTGKTSVHDAEISRLAEKVARKSDDLNVQTKHATGTVTDRDVSATYFSKVKAELKQPNKKFLEKYAALKSQELSGQPATKAQMEDLYKNADAKQKKMVRKKFNKIELE